MCVHKKEKVKKKTNNNILFGRFVCLFVVNCECVSVCMSCQHGAAFPPYKRNTHSKEWANEDKNIEVNSVVRNRNETNDEIQNEACNLTTFTWLISQHNCKHKFSFNLTVSTRVPTKTFKYSSAELQKQSNFQSNVERATRYQNRYAENAKWSIGEIKKVCVIFVSWWCVCCQWENEKNNRK